MDKIITFGILGLLIYYKFFGGKESLDAILNKDEPKEDSSSNGQIEGTSQCASCGVYMTEDDALIYHRKAYCSNECVEASKRLKQ
jgi:hypothetical protein